MGETMKKWTYMKATESCFGQENMKQLFHVMGKMEKMREYSHHSSGPWDSDYDQSSMMEKMFDHSSSSHDSEYDSEFSPSMYKRLFKKDHMDYDSYDSDYSSSFMENMMRNKMKREDSSSYRQRM